MLRSEYFLFYFFFSFSLLGKVAKAPVEQGTTNLIYQYLSNNKSEALMSHCGPSCLHYVGQDEELGFQDQLENPEEMIRFTHISHAGLVLHIVKFKAHANMIRTF